MENNNLPSIPDHGLKLTPGIWEVRKNTDEYKDIFNENGKCISMSPVERNNDNAQVFAAAKMMFEALHFYHSLVNKHYSSRGKTEQLTQARKQMRVAYEYALTGKLKGGSE